MQYIKCDVSTICMGMAASMGAFLLSSGAKGKRFALPNSEIMIHQPSGGAQGQATEIEITAKQILKIRERLNKILADNTGKPIDIIAKDTERDNFMSADEALDYGLVDKILYKDNFGGFLMSRDNDSKGKTMRCSFCGKTQDEVGKLVAGPGGVCICDNCIELCLEIIEDGGGFKQVRKNRAQTDKPLPKPHDIKNFSTNTL